MAMFLKNPLDRIVYQAYSAFVKRHALRSSSPEALSEMKQAGHAYAPSALCLPVLMFRKRWMLSALMCFVAGLAWLVLLRQNDLGRPVMQGKPISYWLELMALDQKDERDPIRDRLVSLGPKTVPALVAALDEQPPVLRLKILRLILNYFPTAYEPAKASLRPRHYPENWMAAYTLSVMPTNPRIRNALIRALQRMGNKNADANIGFYAAQGLGNHYTNDAAVVVPELRAALGSPHDTVAAEAARALPRFGTNALKAIPELIALLSCNDDYLVGHVAWALGRFGRNATNALPALRAQANSQNATTQRKVAVAIWRIAPETGFPAEVLLAHMKSGGLFHERLYAAEELQQLNPAYAPEVVSTFVELIQAGPVTVTNQSTVINWHRREAAQWLGNMGREAKPALPALLVAESDMDESVKTAASETRKKIENCLRNGHDEVLE